jgi:hypothetical protein
VVPSVPQVATPSAMLVIVAVATAIINQFLPKNPNHSPQI